MVWYYGSAFGSKSESVYLAVKISNFDKFSLWSRLLLPDDQNYLDKLKLNQPLSNYLTKEMNDPRPYDAILGGMKPPEGAAILGGLRGWELRFLSGTVLQKIYMLPEIEEYGELGLQRLLDCSLNQEILVQKAIYRLLAKRPESWIKSALLALNPYNCWGCLNTIGRSSNKISAIAITSDSQKLISGTYQGDLDGWDLSSQSLIFTIEANAGIVWSVGISWDGKVIASSHEDNLIHIWDGETREKLTLLEGHLARIDSLIFSKNNQMLISGSSDYTIKLWDLNTGNLIRTLGEHSQGIITLGLSRDGKTLVSGSWDGIKIWDLTSGWLITSLPDSAKVNEISISGDGRTLVSGHCDDFLRIWDLTELKLRDKIYVHRNNILSVAVTVNGEGAIAVVGKEIKLWNLKNKVLQTNLKDSADLTNILLDHSGQKIISLNQQKVIKVWDLTTEKMELTLLKPDDPVDLVVVNPINNQIITSSYDHTIKIRELAYPDGIKTIKYPFDLVSYLMISPNGLMLAGISLNQIIIWELVSQKLFGMLMGHTGLVRAIAISPDSSIIVSAGDDQCIKVWDLVSKKLLATLIGHTGTVRTLSISPNGKILVSGGDDQTLKFWYLPTMTLMGTTSQYYGSVYSVKISPSGHTVANFTYDIHGKVQVWNLMTRQLISRIDNHSGYSSTMTFNLDGQSLIFVSRDNGIHFWDIKKSKVINSLYGHTDSIRSLAISRDGSVMVSGGDDGLVKVWDISNQQLLTTLEGHTNRVEWVGFSPDGQTIISWDRSQILKLWG